MRRIVWNKSNPWALSRVAVELVLFTVIVFVYVRFPSIARSPELFVTWMLAVSLLGIVYFRYVGRGTSNAVRPRAWATGALVAAQTRQFRYLQYRFRRMDERRLRLMAAFPDTYTQFIADMRDAPPITIVTEGDEPVASSLFAGTVRSFGFQVREVPSTDIREIAGTAVGSIITGVPVIALRGSTSRLIENIIRQHHELVGRAERFIISCDDVEQEPELVLRGFERFLSHFPRGFSYAVMGEFVMALAELRKPGGGQWSSTHASEGTHRAFEEWRRS